MAHTPRPAKPAPHPRRRGHSDGSNAGWGGGRDGGTAAEAAAAEVAAAAAAAEAADVADETRPTAVATTGDKN